MPNRSYSKFAKYYSLNEVSKFTNFDNLFLLSKIKSITVWFSLDLSLEKSKYLYKCKGLLGTLLIYLITTKYPKVQSSRDRNQLHIESCLVSSDLAYFLEKFLIIYNSSKRSHLLRDMDIHSNFTRFLIKDFSLFSELEGFNNFFSPVEWLYMDITFNHEDNSRNLILLDNLFTSSTLV